MLSKRAIAAVVGCAVVGTAFAGVSKVKDLAPAGQGLTENPNGDGQVKLRFNAGTFETSIHVHIHSFVPNETYGVKITSDGGGDSNPLALTTNAGGSGTYDVSLPGDMTSNPVVYIYLWDGDWHIDAIDTVTATEVRATGVGVPD